MGFARYPSWITRDWDPNLYAWSPGDSESASDAADGNLALPGADGLCNGDLDIGGRSEIQSLCEEDSPQTLQCYRDEYLEIYTNLDPANAVFTKNSHILEAVQIGIFSEISRGGHRG